LGSNQISWETNNFKNRNSIYQLFKNAGYKLGDPQKIDPKYLPGLKKPSIYNEIKELYQVIYQENELQLWLIITPEKANKKSWRNLIISEVKESYGDYVLLFTKDFSQFWISILADDAYEELLFNINSPSIKADKFIQDLLNKRPLIDVKGLTASILQAKHQLTAKKVATAIKNGEESLVISLFKKAGLNIEGKLNLFAPRREAPLKKTVLKILISKNYDKEMWLKNNLSGLIGEYFATIKEDLDNIIIIFKDCFCYYSSKVVLYQKIDYNFESEDLIDILTSLIACIDVKTAFNSITFESQFGSYSLFFIKSVFLMQEYLKSNVEDIQVVREEWERYFSKVYQAGDIDEELLVKHAYLSLLIKIVLFCRYLPEKIVNNAHSFVELSEFFEKKGIELFINDFYGWANNIEVLRDDIFHALNKAEYESEDIFRVIYQDMVSPSTRHALGEFYTPPELAQLMVDEVYMLGDLTLDPACGSGTFLVEIINKIKSLAKDGKSISKAINNLYGFDVNPIAVLVSKANILLNIEDISNEKIPLNIFLTDSLKVIERNPQTNMMWGSYYTFPLGSFGKLSINERFFKQTKTKDYLKEFLIMLRFIDEIMTETKEYINKMMSSE